MSEVQSYPIASSASVTLSERELAELLAVSRITVFKLAKSGRIPCFKIGTCVRFDPKVVATWLRKM
jgi:excisionase family DNA binding protein